MPTILTENYLLFSGLFGTMLAMASIIGLLIWYIRQLVSRLLHISDNIEDLVILIKNYSNHLKSVYELETFYGDETLQSLLKHTGHTIEELEQYETAEQLMDGEFYEETKKEE
tara:strand:+ start:131 stop:469 length:339 start_codon:yes stop_codon:yes gene_type:complete